MQRNSITEWCNKITSHLEQEEPLIVKLFARKQIHEEIGEGNPGKISQKKIWEKHMET